MKTATEVLSNPVGTTLSAFLDRVSDPKLKGALGKQLIYDKRQLNVQYPREFEYYMIAFELVDQDLTTQKYFIFPIMPSQITERQPYSSNVKRTAGGITTLDSTIFVPVDITLSGNFGRKMKFVMGETTQEFLSSFQKKGTDGKSSVTLKSIYNGVTSLFDSKMKTGYGCIKVLEDLLLQSKTLDDAGRPFKLIFYNLASGNSYYVKPVDFTINQSEQSNMIWNYNLVMKGLAPVSAYNDKSKTNEELTTDGYIQKQVNNVTTKITGLIKDVGKRVPTIR